MELQDSQMGMLRLSLIVGFFIIAYMLYKLSVNIYDNHRIEQHIQEFENTNQALILENKKKLEDFQYYTSEEYIQKIAKQNLGLIKPEEKIIIIPDDSFIVMNQSEEDASISKQIRDSWSYPKRWWKFFFTYNPYKI